MSEISDIERTSLEAHVSLCELRYQQLERRLNQVENKLESLQILLSEIRDSLVQLPAEQNQQQNSRWERFQWAVIGGLSGVATWALARVLHVGLGG